MGIVNNLNIPITYTIGGKVYHSISNKNTVSERNESEKTVFTMIEEVDGFTITAEYTKYKNFDAEEWVVFFKNNSECDSKLLSDVLTADFNFCGSNPELYTCNGDFCSNDGYETTKHVVEDGFVFEQSPVGGRPCDQAFPYQRLIFDEKGYNIAIGWPGQWACRYEAKENNILFSAGQQSVSTILHPGEVFRTPRIAVVAFDGGLENGVNVWRRWYRKHVMRQNVVPLVHGLNNNGGMEFCSATEEQQLKCLAEYVNCGVNINMWWIDAGWYPSITPDGEEDWWKTTGTWHCDKKRFPNGFKNISKFCNEHGIKLLTWFEVERANICTELFEEHPEWMLKNKDKDMQYGFMLDMSNPDCVKYLSETIANFLLENGISVYRQDYNFEPLRYWRYNEKPNRLGMNENLYIQGYLKYWDYLLENVPDLIIDSCASGGRRNDLETMRRAVIMHQTDEAYGNHPVKHAFFQTLYSWLPYFRGFMDSWETEDGDYIKPDYYHQPKPTFDNYNLLSALAPCMNLGGYGYFLDYSENTPDVQQVKDAVNLFHKVSSYMLNGDFYALTPYHKRRDMWSCWQFDVPETGEGVFEVIRNNAAADDTLTVNAHFNGKIEMENLVTGEKMITDSIITFTQPMRSVMVWKYRKIQ